MDGFFLSSDNGATWVEVTEAQWRETERGCGFRPTGGFSSGSIRGSMFHPSTMGRGKLLLDPARVAEEIRNEMVCCDAYSRQADALAKGGTAAVREFRRSDDYHPMCHYGEMAARYVEELASPPGVSS